MRFMVTMLRQSARFSAGNSRQLAFGARRGARLPHAMLYPEHSA